MKPLEFGDASLPEGWRSLSFQSRRELMRGATTPVPGSAAAIVGAPAHPGGEEYSGFIHVPMGPYEITSTALALREFERRTARVAGVIEQAQQRGEPALRLVYVPHQMCFGVASLPEDTTGLGIFQAGEAIPPLVGAALLRWVRATCARTKDLFPRR